MSINLDQKEISINGPEFNAIGGQLQSNILKSHSRDHVRLLFLSCQGAEKRIKGWIKNFISRDEYVVSAMDQRADTAAFKNGMGSKVVVNFYLTAKGYEKLGYDSNRFSDGNIQVDEDEDDSENLEEEVLKKQNLLYGNNAFVHGMKSIKVNKRLKDPEPRVWEQEYNSDIHAMILLADDDTARLDSEATKVKDSLQGIAMIVKEEIGNDITEKLPSGRKIHVEHFGFSDGISQPRFFIEDSRTSPLDLQPLNIVLVKDPFTAGSDNNYGSFLVFRKLEQDVEGFNQKVSELASKLNLNGNQVGKISKEDYAAALVIGRFKDGTPLVKSDIKLGESPAFNDFRYEQIDRPAHKCPFHAHIRKTNPRGQGLLVGQKYITRRGIPYGAKDLPVKKGLLFMCFQSNLKRQFNFIQKAWANAPGFPPFRHRPGIDPLIGQGHEGGQSWPKQFGVDQEIEFNFSGFVKMKGGEYFFAPSIGFLKNI